MYCDVCQENIAIKYCNQFRTKICRFCCDEYQLSGKDISHCLNCDLMIRENSPDIELTGYGQILSHRYKNHYVFDSDFLNLNKKVIQLYRQHYMHDVNGRYNLALQLHYDNQNDEALELMLNIKNDIEVNYDYYKSFADIQLSERNFKEAIQSYFKALDFEEHSYIYRRIGESYNALKINDRSVYYHEKALSKFYEGDSEDFLYFMNYYSLALNHSELKNYAEAISNGEELLNYYGNFKTIKERVLSRTEILGDLYIKDIIRSTYKLLALTYYENKDYTNSKAYVDYTIELECYDLDLAKVNGYCEAKLEADYDIESMLESHIKAGKVIVIDGGTIDMSTYNVNNNGTMTNVNIGKNNNIELSNESINEIERILDKILNNREEIDFPKLDNSVDEIKNNIRSYNFSNIKSNLSNLLIGITSSCIANGLSDIVTELSNVVNKL
jgi:tetratricopeptide (TPR) repeat protein